MVMFYETLARVDGPRTFSECSSGITATRLQMCGEGNLEASSVTPVTGQNDSRKGCTLESVNIFPALID